MTLDLVVARYQEPARWVNNTPRSLRVFVYDKGGDLPPTDLPRAQIEARPNRGHEAETYCHHILSHWDELADVTVFCQGHPFDHAHDLHAVLRRLASGELVVADFHWLGFTIDTDDPRGRRLFVPWSKNRDGRELALDEFHLCLFETEAPSKIRFYLGGQFAVQRALIHARGRAFFERAQALATDFPDAAHCFERLWDRVFGVLGVDPSVLGEKDCVYLKPIKAPRHASL